MRVSVLVPAYNCAATIVPTIESVLQQTLVPHEILVMNDGSTDDTEKVLQTFGGKIRVFKQPNQGLASARNELIPHATGDLIAFLDSDDLWHPDYLKSQERRFLEYPDAVAFWTGHVNFSGKAGYDWTDAPSESEERVEVIPALEFFKRYNSRTGPFSCFSYCCVPKEVFTRVGKEPFREMGAEDSYCCSLLSLVGPVVLTSTDLVAYRLRDDSLSKDHGWTFGVWVHVFELLEEKFEAEANAALLGAFRAAFASKRRVYAKLLMGMGRTRDARGQLRQSVQNSGNPRSVAKSLTLLSMTYLPRRMQPRWPSQFRPG